ncbi:MAG: hypothetical protein Q8S13_01045 [Dehalococcoidia bacterium]|nr:hypothetical protein [Dehalococcoidia bacterium]
MPPTTKKLRVLRARRAEQLDAARAEFAEALAVAIERHGLTTADVLQILGGAVAVYAARVVGEKG